MKDICSLIQKKYQARLFDIVVLKKILCRIADCFQEQNNRDKIKVEIYRVLNNQYEDLLEKYKDIEYTECSKTFLQDLLEELKHGRE